MEEAGCVGVGGPVEEAGCAGADEPVEEAGCVGVDESVEEAGCVSIGGAADDNIEVFDNKHILATIISSTLRIFLLYILYTSKSLDFLGTSSIAEERWEAVSFNSLNLCWTNL